MSKPRDGASFYRQYNKARAEEAKRKKAEEEKQKIRAILGIKERNKSPSVER